MGRAAQPVATMDGEITVDELQSLLDGDGPDDLRIVDIRPPAAFRRGHIPGSENVPAAELTDRIEDLDGAERVVTVCPHGKSSVQAARLIASYEGVEGPVESLKEGLDGWDGPLDAADGDAADDEGPAAPF